MPVMSPRTQQLQAGMNAGPDQEVALFEQGFSEMAYNLLASRMPDVMQDVVTFKVLDVDIDQGTGTGAFVVLRNGAPIYIPVVMCDNAIKPLEVFYHKTSNVFLPLTKGWLDETDKNTLGALGGGVKTPETLYTDVDIRNVVVPPITGRFSYAAWMPKAMVDVARVCSRENLEKAATEYKHQALLPAFLEKIPNRAKTAMVAVLGERPSIMQHLAAYYGVSKIASALVLREEKTAAKQLTGGALWIADKDTTPSEFNRVFGDKAGEAYAGVRLKGFAARDTRAKRNMLVTEQPFDQWVEPNQPGVYVLFDTASKEHPALVVPNPVNIFDEGNRYTRRPRVPAHTPQVDRAYPSGRPEDSSLLTRSFGAHKYIAVFGDGSYITPDKLVGRPSVADEISGPLHKRMFVDVDGSPRAGKGFFVRQKGTSFEATVPLEIKSISTNSDGTRRIKVTDGMGFPERVVVTDPRSPYSSIWMPRDADIVYVPADFIWVPLKERGNAKAYFTSALDLQACISSALSSAGAKKVSVKDAGARQFSVNGARAVTRVDALKKLAYELRLSVDDADALLTKAASDRTTSAWVISNTVKVGADDDKKSDDKPKKKPPSNDGGGSGPGMDAGADPGLGEEAAMAAMGPPPAPPAPTPVEMAAMEMDQHLQQEMQKLQEKQQMLAMLVQRSSEISGGAPPAPTVQSQAMGAPPSSMNLATGGPTPGPGPTAGMGMGAPPPPMGADPSMAPMPGEPVPPNAMDPSMGGQPQMGMDPSMGGQPQMGMDPSMGGQPPIGAMMPPDGPNGQALDMEVNPQFLDQAAALHSADMFDAAAVATLAQSPELHGIVAQYLPNLEKAVDNLGRVMLTLWMQEYDLKPQIGEATFTGLEENLQSTFKNLGDLVLRLSRGVQAIKEPGDHAP